MEATHDSIRRARPLLGTFVEIAVAGASIPTMEAAVEAAFAAVTTVHRLMSFHEAASDVSRLNRDAWSRAVRVHDWTYQVLETALDLNRRSRGIFDVAVALTLQKLGLLPCTPSPLPSPLWGGAGGGGGGMGHVDATTPRPPTPTLPHKGGGKRPLTRPACRTSNLIQLLPENQVRFAHCGVRIDLGGIAKGFAVDRAIEVLRRHGITDGLVNAGGDLAAFGRRSHQVDVRDPGQPDRPLCRVALSNAALASSASRFDPFRAEHASVAAVVDPFAGRPVRAISGATVCAPSCVIADALTKVVMNGGEGAAGLLQHYGARALFVSAQGCIHMTTGWNNEVRFAA